MGRSQIVSSSPNKFHSNLPTQYRRDDESVILSTLARDLSNLMYEHSGRIKDLYLDSPNLAIFRICPILGMGEI